MECPQRVAVVGGGYIGVELAGVFHALGTETHYFTRADKPLKEFDEIVTSSLMAEMKKQGLTHYPHQVPIAYCIVVFRYFLSSSTKFSYSKS